MDVHTGTAAEIFGVSPKEVTTDMRRIAKTVNFGVVYGISPYGLSEAISITPKEAGQYIDCYFEKHPGVKAYMDNIIMFAREKGYVATLLGRKRRIPEIRNPNTNARLQAERFAINTPIQGSAADLIKTAMINLAGRLRAQGMKSRIVLQIHDELLLETPSHELKEVGVMLKHEMENAMQLSVPLRVDIGWGPNWAEAH
jgi:DNA polymerase-1